MTKICIEDGCKTQCFFGPENGKPIFCKKHKKDGMVDNCSKKCFYKDCKKSSSFNFSGLTAKYCFAHKLEQMVNVNHKTCDNEYCSRSKCYGFKGEKQRYCKKHKIEGMVDVVHKLCEFENCQYRPNYGIIEKKPTHCSIHKSSLMKDVVNKYCTSCGLYTTLKKNNYLCYYCQPTPRMMKKETKVKTLLEENNIVFVHNKQINNDCCLKYRPDFLFDCNTYFVVLECDEDQHSSYDKDCEIIRMNNISTGLGLPTLFIRYNPDLPGFKVKQKHKKLLETLDKYLNMEILEDPTPIYLFYKEK